MILMFSNFFSWQYFLRLFLAFAIPYLLFSAIMQQVAVQLNKSLSGEDNLPRVAFVSNHSLPLLLQKEIAQNSTTQLFGSRLAAQKQLNKDSIDIILMGNSKQKIEAIYNSANEYSAAHQVLDLLEDLEQKKLYHYLDSLGVDISPVRNEIEEQNLFSPMQMLEKIVLQVKSNLANILNLLFILLVSWVARSILLRGRSIAFLPLFLFAYLSVLVASIAVFYGFSYGVNIEEKGMIQGFIMNINSIIKWENLADFLWLWLPSWLFIIASLGVVINLGNDFHKAYSRSFWWLIGFILIAFAAVSPIGSISNLTAALPIYNIFAVGQMVMQQQLNDTTWYLAMGSTTGFGLLLLGLWYWLSKRNNI